MAYDDMMLAMNKLDKTRFWYSVHAFLMGVGNVSKLLWNKDARFQTLRKELREGLSITAESPLYDRRFRNIYEHYDERLERWAKESEGKGMIDGMINPFLEDLTVTKNKGLKNILRHYDNAKKVLTFRGESYAIEPVVKELENLLLKTEQESSKPSKQDSGLPEY